MGKPVPTRLSNFPLVEVKVACSLCPRRGCYRLARLAVYFGSEMDLDKVLDHLASDCPYHRSGHKPRKYEARCGAHFLEVDLSRPVLELPPERKRLQPDKPPYIPMLKDIVPPVVEIVCNLCNRRGVYSVARLIEKYGADMKLYEFTATIAGDCPRKIARKMDEPCRAMFTKAWDRP